MVRENRELGVHPGRRRRGIGGRLHDELLERAGRPMAVLATEVDNRAAIAFYGDRAWETIIPEIRIGRPYRVMGLAVTPTRSSTGVST
jgi:ribosomal protein S18 acetylase RimI-like enzyme